MTYAGDVEPTAAYESVASDPHAVLVDVRTRPELAYVGHPDLSNVEKQLIAVEWVQFPNGQQNPNFLDELRAHGVSPDQPVYFICRSGVRSRFAAELATSAGFTEAYNVAHGFEGPIDPNGHRGTSVGWKADGLPWRQT